MSKGSKRKTPHSGPHGEARKMITQRNKIRRAKRLAKKLLRLREPARVARLQQERLARYLPNKERRDANRARVKEALAKAKAERERLERIEKNSAEIQKRVAAGTDTIIDGTA